MLRVEDSARRRFALLGGVVGLFLGGLILSGILNRFSQTFDGDSRIDPKDILQARVEVQQVREIRDEAAQIGKKGHWDDAVHFLDGASKDHGTLPLLRAEAALRAGRLEEAKKGFLVFMPSEDPVSYGTRLILAGKMDEFHAYCQKTILAENGNPADARTANNIAWLSVLTPNAVPDYSAAIELAKIGVVETNDDDRANFLNTLGAVEFRAGHPQEAIEALQGAEHIQSDPFNWVFLAMAYHQIGDTKQDRKYFTQVRDYLDKTFGKPAATNRHELLLFFQEAETALQVGPTVK
jgi:tetratricopeptide (TPR) repeat protein